MAVALWIAGGYVRRAYNSARWDEVPCALVPVTMRCPRACSSRRSGLVTALCAAVGIAFLLAPAPAFAQSTTLVSNLDRLSTLKPAYGIYAQSFRTGAHTAGYTIRSVQVRLAAGSVTSSTKTSVLIRQERNGEPGALVTALTTQSPLVDGVNTFAAPANTILNPQTNYFVTVNEATPPPTGAPVGVPFVAGPRAVYELTGSREQSGADGWSIDDKRLYKNHLSQEWGTSDRIFLFIGVNGDVHTPNTGQQVEIVPPTVDGTPSVSGAGTDAQWSVGETVGVTVTFQRGGGCGHLGRDAVHRHRPGRHGGAQRDVRERDRDHGARLRVHAGFRRRLARLHGGDAEQPGAQWRNHPQRGESDECAACAQRHGGAGQQHAQHRAGGKLPGRAEEP